MSELSQIYADMRELSRIKKQSNLIKQVLEMLSVSLDYGLN